MRLVVAAMKPTLLSHHRELLLQRPLQQNWATLVSLGFSNVRSSGQGLCALEPLFRTSSSRHHRLLGRQGAISYLERFEDDSR